MRKFWILLKKEVRDLLTVQTILPLVATVLIFMFLGGLMTSEQEKAAGPAKAVVLDLDRSLISADLIEILRKNNTEITLSAEQTVDGALAKTKAEKRELLLVIPLGFEEGLGAGEQKNIEIYSIMRSFAMLSNQGYLNLMGSLAISNEILSNSLITQAIPGVDISKIKQPILPVEKVVVNDRQASASLASIMGFVTQQNMMIPLILFMVIVYASQMVATAIANEKENKTLETLLSTPVDRKAIAIAKMSGAGLIALIATGFYMIGIRSYLNGLGLSASGQDSAAEAAKSLGLALTPEGYVLLAVSLFMAILVALSISLILGAFAEDVKSVAGLTMPIMLMAMLPYFLTVFLDINSLPAVLRYITYAIPFSHVFMATSNLFNGNYLAVIWGITYQGVWCLGFIWLASKIFGSDLIMTMKLNFSRKKQ